MGIDDLLRIPPVFQIEVNGRTRSGTIQGQGNGQVLQTGGLQPHQHVPHTGTFELEHAGGISAGKHGINCRIVQRDRIYGECRFILLNGTDTVPDNCQVPQPQKIKFQQAHSFQNAHGILGDDGFLISLQRHQISDRHRRDQHAGSMGRSVPRHALHLHCHIDQLFCCRIGFIQFPQVFPVLALHGFRNALSGIDRLCNFVAQPVGNPHCPSGIPNGSPCLHQVESDDFRHPIGTIAGDHILLDTLSALYAEVNVKIRHADTLRIQEAFKQQLVSQRVDLGNAHTVGTQTSRTGTTPRSNGNVVTSGEIDIVPHDQKVIHVSHLGNHRDLHTQPFQHLR